MTRGATGPGQHEVTGAPEAGAAGTGNEEKQ